MVGLGVDFADVTDYVAENDLGTATLLRALHDLAWSGRLVLASSMVVYGEGISRCDQHGIVRPPPRGAAALDAGQFEPACPQCGRALVPVSVPEDCAPRSEKRLCRHQTAPRTPLQRLRSRARRRHVDGAAIPQRVRTADASKHPVRRRRQHLPQRARTRRITAGVRRRRSAPRLHPRARHRPGQSHRPHR